MNHREFAKLELWSREIKNTDLPHLLSSLTSGIRLALKVFCQPLKSPFSTVLKLLFALFNPKQENSF